MINFSPINDGELTYIDYAERERIDAAALMRHSDESIDFLVGLLEDLTDEEIVFEPEDP